MRGFVGGLGGVGLRFFVKGLQEDTCTGVSFQVKMQAEGLQIYRKRDPAQVFSCEFCEMFKNSYFVERLHFYFCFVYYFSVK